MTSSESKGFSAWFRETVRAFRDWISGETARIRAWQKWIPMSHEKAIEILKRDLPKDTKVTLDVSKDGTGSINVTSDLISESREFDLKKKITFPGCMEIVKAAEGNGLGRHLMRNEFEFFKACGVKKYKIYAALDAGGYAWARLGFLPDDVDDIKPEAKDNFLKIRPLLNKKEKDLLKDITKFKDPADIWRLADVRIDMLPRLQAIFKKAAEGGKRAQQIVDNIEAINDSDEIFSDLKNMKSIAIGRLVLAGTTWDGHIDFDNAEQMKRVEQYVGGWKYKP